MNELYERKNGLWPKGRPSDKPLKYTCIRCGRMFSSRKGYRLHYLECRRRRTFVSASLSQIMEDGGPLSLETLDEGVIEGAIRWKLNRGSVERFARQLSEHLDVLEVDARRIAEFLDGCTIEELHAARNGRVKPGTGGAARRVSEPRFRANVESPSRRRSPKPQDLRSWVE